ncbi:MAG: SUMF1/EgtB/PvdO family nonheme iron enzyme [Verrucomicrobia bacterium]|nr:SUMF1/EgtB/PvdO family nonheme iron enzyme [Verrucomicrobiota bacterium]
MAGTTKHPAQIGGYTITALIGGGGMGAVYKARQPVLDRDVALKVIAPEVAKDAAYIARFQQEAKSAAKLNHPNIVQVYAAGEDQGTHFLVEEFVEGENLHERLARDGRMDPQEALAVCVFVADGLKYAWDEARLIHRDIKPANIFLSNKGAVKVGDLGLAKSVGTEGGSSLTQSGMAVGTPYYCSPEQARADKEVDFRSDIYGLGCTLYHMLSGKKPYEGAADESPMSVMIKQATGASPMILQVLPTCPPPIVVLLGKMLAKHPTGRHQSYGELIADLRRLHDLLGQPKASAPISSALHAAVTAKTKKPAPTMIYGGIAAAVAVVFVGGLLLWAPWKSGTDEKGRREDAKTEAQQNVAERASVQKEPAKMEPADRALARPATTEAAPAKPADKKTPAPVIAKTQHPLEPRVTSHESRPAPVDSAFIAAVAALAPEDQVSRVMDKLLLLNPKFDGKHAHKIENGKVTELTFSTAEVGDISPLKALKDLQSLTIGGTAQKRALADLSPLKGLKLTKLAIHSTAVSDLTPLAGMPLASLQMSNTRVTDLAPLKGAPLTWLSCVDSPVKDLAPLADAPLATLWCGGSQVTDFSPLKAVPLKELSCDFQPDRDKEALWAIKTLESINGKSAADFWKEVGAPEDPWFKQIAALPAEQQVAAVVAKLKELNPGFDGKETHKVESIGQTLLSGQSATKQGPATLLSPRSSGDGATGVSPLPAITELAFSTVAVTNIVPLKVLTGLKKLTLLPWQQGAKSPLSDLTPLTGLPLTFLACGNSQVADLTPLKGMPLTILSVDNTPVSDLSPLAGMPLTILWCNGTRVTDLSPLAGAPLMELRCDVKPEHAPLLASIPTLRKINDLAPAALWMRMRIKPPVPSVVGRVPSPGATSGATTTTPPGQGTGPTSLKPGAAAQTGQPLMTSIGMELLYIPPGEFLLGSTPEEQAWALQHDCPTDNVKSEGKAPRKAAIKQGFWLGKTEVTVGQWKLFVAATGYVTDGEKKGASTTLRPDKTWGSVAGANWKDPNFGFKLKDNHPVSCISWNDAMAFCKWLNERETKAGGPPRTLSGLPPGYTFRLPAEAEWEYACRAGKQTKFWWGDTKEGGDGRLNWNGKADGFEFTSPVDHYGSRGRNKFGLADMLGNVCEWCLDEFDETQAHEECYKGNPSVHVLRGVSFQRSYALCRCAARDYRHCANSTSNHGFRVCFGMEPIGKTAASTPASSDATQKPPSAPPITPPVALPTPARVDAVTLPRSATAAAQTGQPLMTSIGMELLYIPPGEFMLGSTPEEQAWAVLNGCRADSVKIEGKTPHKTAIKQGFWLGKTEVTVGQWKFFVAATGYVTDGEKKGGSSTALGPGKTFGMVAGANWKDPNFGFKLKDDHPVSCISWNDAMAFCKWLNERETKAGGLLRTLSGLPPGYTFRLPTEAEWEYACRAGKQTKFWWGDTKEGGDGRLNWWGTADGFEFVSPADHYGSRGRNKFGLADMLGNVGEWCLDEFDETQAHEECYKGNPNSRVLRGVSFYPFYALCRCAARDYRHQANSTSSHGFRVCFGMEPIGKTPASTPATSDATQKPPSAPPTTPPAATAAAQPGQPLMTSTGMELLYIPPGEFLLGSTPEERAWANANGGKEEDVKREGEAPRKTAIKQGFWLGKTEVTVGQWKQFAATGYQTDAEKKGFVGEAPTGPGKPWVLKVPGVSWKDPNFGFKLKDNHPVSCINWNDAVAFCEWLNEREQKSGRLPPGYKVRLPGEAEWEYACRAGKQTRFWWGETKEGIESRLNRSEKEDGFEYVSPVDHYGSRGRNKFGLADMLGNVWEWCLDEFDETQAHEECYKGNPGARVLRGGSFYYIPGYARCALRLYNSPSDSPSIDGFRVAVGVER